VYRNKVNTEKTLTIKKKGISVRGLLNSYDSRHKISIKRPDSTKAPFTGKRII